MGLFSSKKKYEVYVTVQDVFQPGQIPNSALNGIIKGIMGDGMLIENMMEDVTGSIGVRARRGFDWLKRQNYPIGLPSHGYKSYISAATPVMQAISANIGRAITPEYYFMGPLNSMHFGWQHCHSALKYDPATNELVKLSEDTGFKCYLADMKATYLRADYDWMVETNDMGMLDQLGPSPTSGWLPSKPYNTLEGMGQYASQPAFEVSDVATEDYITITYEFENADGVFIRRGITVSLANYDNTADFHQCRYKQDNGVTGFFTYQNATGTYPLIDAAMIFEKAPVGSYLPWTYFRHSGMEITEAEGPYTVEKLIEWCNYLGVDFNSMNDGVHQDPNVDDVEQAIMMFGINPGDDHPAQVEYLFKYFSTLYTLTSPQSQLVNGLYKRMQAFTSSPSSALRVQDNRFAMTFQYSGIHRQRVSGKIGPRGTYSGSFTQASQNSQHFLTQGRNGVSVASSAPTQPGWVYRYQVLDSVYEEVAVYGLRVNYEVHRKKGFAAGEQMAELLLPLDMTVVRTMGIPAQEQLLCRTLRMMVNTVITIKTPWYASGVMKGIMLVVAIVITIYSAGTGWQALVAAAGTTGSLALTIAVTIAKIIVVQVGIKLFVKKFGPELGLIAAVVAVAAAAYGYATDASWAQGLLSVSSGLTQESNTALQTMVDDTIEKLGDFQAWAAGEMESLEEQREALGLNPMFVGLDTFDVVQLAPSIVFGEMPTAYYARTVHAGNIGAMSYDMIEHYVTGALTLPQLSAVEGDFYDGDIPTA